MAGIADLVKEVTASFDVKKFVEIGSDLIEQVREHSKEIALQMEQDALRLQEVVKRQQSGKLDAVGAKRARGRYRRVLEARIKTLGNKALWEGLQASWDAEDQLFHWLGILASGLIKLI